MITIQQFVDKLVSEGIEYTIMHGLPIDALEDATVRAAAADVHSAIEYLVSVLPSEVQDELV